MLIVVRGFAQGEAGARLEGPEPTSWKGLEQSGEPGLEVGPDVKEKVGFRKASDVGRPRLPCMDSGAGRKEEAGLSPVSGDGRGEFAQGKYGSHDPDLGLEGIRTPNKYGQDDRQEEASE
jgi:hypothetical protein